MNLDSFINAIGLAFDILGAWYLAKGLIKKSYSSMTNESGTYYDKNIFLHISSIVQKYESILGFSYMFIGFGLQATSDFLDNSKVKLLCITMVLVFALIVITFIYYFFRNVRIKVVKPVINDFITLINGELNDNFVDCFLDALFIKHKGLPFDKKRTILEDNLH